MPTDSLLLFHFLVNFPTFNFSSALIITQFSLPFNGLAAFAGCAFSFAPFFSPIFFLFVCVCLFVAGIASGSSPTPSQNEAQPPSTDWPVSAYCSSFSMSSPETDDAGTWMIWTTLTPHCSEWIAAGRPFPLSTATQNLNHSVKNHIPRVYSSPCPCVIRPSFLPISSAVVQCISPVLLYGLYLCSPCLWHG